MQICDNMYKSPVIISCFWERLLPNDHQFIVSRLPNYRTVSHTGRYSCNVITFSYYVHGSSLHIEFIYPTHPEFGSATYRIADKLRDKLYGQNSLTGSRPTGKTTTAAAAAANIETSQITTQLSPHFRSLAYKLVDLGGDHAWVRTAECIHISGC